MSYSRFSGHGILGLSDAGWVTPLRVPSCDVPTGYRGGWTFLSLSSCIPRILHDNDES